MNEVEKFDECSNGALRKATRHVGLLFDDTIRVCGLRASQRILLDQVAVLQHPTIKQLATALVMDRSALGHTLQPLVRTGLVRLAVHETDRRSKRVSLTSLGKAKLEGSRTLWGVAQSRFVVALGKEKAQQLRDILDVVASPSFADAFRGFRPD